MSFQVDKIIFYKNLLCFFSQSIYKMIIALQDHMRNHPDDYDMAENAISLYLGLASVPKYESDSTQITPYTASKYLNI